jgi:uncharacterized protein (DUF488 family)
MIQSMKIFSIGHSNRSLAELIETLETFSIQAVADVRRVPKSKFCPHFNRVILEAVLPQSGIDYIWMGKGLGGYRLPSLKESPNKGWQIKGFQYYADYALSEEFERALFGLEKIAEKKRTAFMCSERMHQKCHRQIISDYLISLGWEVVHIIDELSCIDHKVTPFARIEGRRITYPPRYELRTLLDFTE